MMGCFAVFPDGAGSPAAVFENLEDAMDWGLKRYGDDAFGIRYLEMAQVESAEERGAPVRTELGRRIATNPVAFASTTALTRQACRVRSVVQRVRRRGLRAPA